MHEFGHAFGLADRYGGEDIPRTPESIYDGIMNPQEGDDTIKLDDKKALIAIYETRIKGRGW